MGFLLYSLPMPPSPSPPHLQLLPLASLYFPIALFVLHICLRFDLFDVFLFQMVPFMFFGGFGGSEPSFFATRKVYRKPTQINRTLTYSMCYVFFHVLFESDTTSGKRSTIAPLLSTQHQGICPHMANEWPERAGPGPEPLGPGLQRKAWAHAAALGLMARVQAWPYVRTYSQMLH